MVVTAVAAPLSLLLVGLSLKPFRRCIAALEF
jgi:hypothetical protein